MKNFIIHKDKESASYRGFNIKPEYFFDKSGKITSWSYSNRIDTTGEHIKVDLLCDNKYSGNTNFYFFAIYYSKSASKKLKLRKLFLCQVNDKSIEISALKC